MIPVLAIPVLSRPDLLRRVLSSVDVPVERLLVIDNGTDPNIARVGCEFGADVIRVGGNLGVAASWNLAIKANARSAWWAIANVDVEFAPTDLARLADAMTDEPKVACLLRFGAFGINRAALETVGLFDENFYPIYAEDADYEYRCRLAGVPILNLPSGTQHVEGGSVTIREPGTDNGRTYPEQLRYFERKWGGALRGGERFTTPFDRGGSVMDWTLEPARLRELAWSA